MGLPFAKCFRPFKGIFLRLGGLYLVIRSTSGIRLKIPDNVLLTLPLSYIREFVVPFLDTFLSNATWVRSHVVRVGLCRAAEFVM